MVKDNKKDDKNSVIDGSDSSIGKNASIEYLLMTLDFEQWKSLSNIRRKAYPVTLEDKRKLLSEMMVV